jgi:hypothetical protein
MLPGFSACRSEDEQAADGAANGAEVHMSAKDTARAAQRAAAMDKFNNQIRQLDDMVSCLNCVTNTLCNRDRPTVVVQVG